MSSLVYGTILFVVQAANIHESLLCGPLMIGINTVSVSSTTLRMIIRSPWFP